MIFLVQYDRRKGSLVSMDIYPDEQRGKAEDERLALELANNRTGLVREVVLLQASSEQALRKTHRRYFEGLSDLARAAG